MKKGEDKQREKENKEGGEGGEECSGEGVMEGRRRWEWEKCMLVSEWSM